MQRKGGMDHKGMRKLIEESFVAALRNIPGNGRAVAGIFDWAMKIADDKVNILIDQRKVASQNAKNQKDMKQLKQEQEQMEKVKDAQALAQLNNNQEKKEKVEEEEDEDEQLQLAMALSMSSTTPSSSTSTPLQLSETKEEINEATKEEAKETTKEKKKERNPQELSLSQESSTQQWYSRCVELFREPLDMGINNTGNIHGYDR
jgi:chemotaxis protein histidine kinase CheA|tara:strand:+ start:379 stop:990 length:612 start_codon:yes stop_codon:yes gene_type:complete